MTREEVKEQIQEDILCALEGLGIENKINHQEYEALKNILCQIVIVNINNLD